MTTLLLILELQEPPKTFATGFEGPCTLVNDEKISS